MAQRATDRGKTEIICPVCDTPISLVEREEVMSPATEAVVAKMERRADFERDRAAAVSVIEGKRETNDYDVFLCHNSKDKPAVKDIGEKLIERGILPWLDEWEIRPGERWQKALEKQIENVRAAAVFVGPEGISHWEDFEKDAFINDFLRRGRPVIPVILPTYKGRVELPILLKQFQRVDFRKKDPDPLEQLDWGITGERGLR